MNDPYLKHGLSLTDLFKLSLRVFKTKPLRTFLTILGMSFGISAVLFLVSLGYGLQYTLLGKLVATEDSLITLEAFYPAETELNITYEDLKTISEIRSRRNQPSGGIHRRNKIRRLDWINFY